MMGMPIHMPLNIRSIASLWPHLPPPIPIKFKPGKENEKIPHIIETQ